RHAGGEAQSVAGKIALAALGLVRDARLQDLPIILGQRGFLAESPGLGLVEGRLTAEPADDESRPRALPVRVFRRVGRLGADGYRQRRHHDRTDQTATMHAVLPCVLALSSCPVFLPCGLASLRNTRRCLADAATALLSVLTH